MNERPEANSLVGAVAGAAVAGLCALYVAVLAVGLLTLPTPDAQIQDPWFTAMEILILAIAPAMVALAVSIHAASPPERRTAASMGIVFFAMCAAVTSAVHFAVLTLSRRPEFQDDLWLGLVFSFQWPSLVYALDILAWDVFFPLGAIAAAASLEGRGTVRAARTLLIVSAALAFAGLLGVPLADMQVRNVGIVGYAVIYPCAAALLTLHFVSSRHGGARKGRAESLKEELPL